MNIFEPPQDGTELHGSSPAATTRRDSDAGIPEPLQAFSGHILTKWTDGRLSPERHRVVAGGTVTRRSTGVFWHPSLNTVIEPLEPFVGPEGTDFEPELLRPAVAPPVGAHEGSTVFYDLVIGGETVANAAWSYPGLPGHIAFEWFQHEGEVLEHWYEEEEVFVHPRDPYKRIDPLPSSRHVRVEIGGRVVAETRRPVLLLETGLPTRHYIPPEDVNLELFEPTATVTRCPYKGVASYWSLCGGGSVPPDVAWAYPAPIPAAERIRDHVAFYNEVVDIVVDGVRLQRPVTLFTERLSDV